MGWYCLCVYILCLFIRLFVLFCWCVVVCCYLFAVYVRSYCLTLGLLRALNVFSNLSLSIECRLLCYVFVYVIVFYLTTAHQASFSLRPTGQRIVLTNCFCLQALWSCGPLSGYSFDSEIADCSLPTGRRVPTALWAMIVFNG